MIIPSRIKTAFETFRLACPISRPDEEGSESSDNGEKQVGIDNCVIHPQFLSPLSDPAAAV